MKLLHHSDNGQRELSQEASLTVPLATTEALQWNLNRHFNPTLGNPKSAISPSLPRKSWGILLGNAIEKEIS